MSSRTLRRASLLRGASRFMILTICGAVLAACGSRQGETDDFFTSGDREADQRAEQRIARDQQLRGEVVEEGEEQRTLYERLGGEQGVKAIVADFLERAIADPRVNWERKGVTTGVLLGRESQEWLPTRENLDKLALHMAQFISLATGGPTEYRGREMEVVHEGMAITNAQFDATVGDLKATLDRLGIADQEQKELLAVIESTRVQVVEER